MSRASETICLMPSGAIYATESSVFVQSGTLFKCNVASAGSGGGVYALSSVVSINKAVFKENIGSSGGGWSLPNL